MFPLQRDNELVIQFSNSLHQHQHKISQEDYDSLDHEKRKKKIFNHEAADPKEHIKKKIVHRDIERQRRQEMATLHGSLRSLLPHEFIKGKRSISDQINEARNYIKHLQKNIQELSAKRDEINKICNNSKLENCETKPASSSVTIHQNNNGAVGIEISEEGLPLSKLLELMVKEGLEVVSCLSTKVNGKFLHSVQCEVNRSNSVDLSELRRKFGSPIPSFKCYDI